MKYLLGVAFCIVIISTSTTGLFLQNRAGEPIVTVNSSNAELVEELRAVKVQLAAQQALISKQDAQNKRVGDQYSNLLSSMFEINQRLEMLSMGGGQGADIASVMSRLDSIYGRVHDLDTSVAVKLDQLTQTPPSPAVGETSGSNMELQHAQQELRRLNAMLRETEQREQDLRKQLDEASQPRAFAVLDQNGHVLTHIERAVVDNKGGLLLSFRTRPDIEVKGTYPIQYLNND